MKILKPAQHQFAATKLEATQWWKSLNHFLASAAPAVSAVNNMVGDCCYMGFVVDAKGHIDWALAATIICIRFPSSMLMLATNKKARKYIREHEKNILLSFLDAGQKLARRRVYGIRKYIPRFVRKKAPGNFTLSFMGYTIAGTGVLVDGINHFVSVPNQTAHLAELVHDVTTFDIGKAFANPVLPACVQTLTGIFIAVGAGTYAASGLNRIQHDDDVHKKYTAAARYLLFPLPFLNAMNTALAGGLSVKSALLTVITGLGLMQLFTRQHLHSKIDGATSPTRKAPSSTSVEAERLTL